MVRGILATASVAAALAGSAQAAPPTLKMAVIDHGDTIRLTIGRAGWVSVTNSRDGFSQTYQVK
jgi:hypothetical protein